MENANIAQKTSEPHRVQMVWVRNHTHTHTHTHTPQKYRPLGEGESEDREVREKIVRCIVFYFMSFISFRLSTFSNDSLLLRSRFRSPMVSLNPMFSDDRVFAAIMRKGQTPGFFL